MRIVQKLLIKKNEDIAILLLLQSNRGKKDNKIHTRDVKGYINFCCTSYNVHFDIYHFPCRRMFFSLFQVIFGHNSCSGLPLVTLAPLSITILPKAVLALKAAT